MHKMKTGEISEIRKTGAAEPTPSTRKGADDETSMLLSVEKVSAASVQDGEQWFDIMRFRRLDARICHMAIPRAESQAPKKVVALLRAAGAAGADDYRFSEAVAGSVLAKESAVGTIIIRGGWFGAPGKLFALPTGLLRAPNLAAADERPLFVCLNFDQRKPWQLVVKGGSPAEANLKIRSRGTTKCWKSDVAAPARHSSAIMLCISAAFAAPLLKLMGVPPFTIFLTGATTGGKTTATLVAASVIGLGSEKEICSWYMTPAGLEQRAEIHSDMLLPIDDLANSTSSEKQLYELVTEVTYRITSGARKFTLTAAKSALTGRPALKEDISTIVLTSYEEGLNEIARAANREIPAGVRVRFLEIPIEPPENGGVFDLIPKAYAAEDRVASAKQLAERLTRSSAKNHGCVFRKWIRAIMKNPAKVKKQVKLAGEAFMAACVIDRKRPIELRHAERFAFIYGAVAYAIDRKLLPWTREESLAAILKCHAASNGTIPCEVDELKEGREQLARRLHDPDRVVHEAEVSDVEKIDGWWTKDSGAKIYFIVGTRWREFFSSDKQRKVVEDYLLKKAILIPGADGKLTKQRKLPNTLRKGPRVYELCYPITKKKLSLK